MNYFRNLSLKRKIAIAFCALLACFAVVAGVVLSGMINLAAKDAKPNAPTHTVQKTAVISPVHSYDAITEAKLYNANVAVYANKTTVSNLKQNLTVTATFRDGGNVDRKVMLSPDEYTLSVKIGDFAATEKQDGDLIFEVPEDGALPKAITVTVLCNGKKSGEISLSAANIKAEKDFPVYTAISVNDLGTIENDYTEDSLKYYDGLIVKGTTDGGEQVTVYNREFYDVTSLTMPQVSTSGGAGAFTVTLAGNTGIFASGKIAGATHAQLISAALNINTDILEKSGEYYKYKNSEFSAFVVNMSQEKILQGLVLTAYYAHSYEKVTLEFNGGNLSSTATAGDKTVTVGWTSTPDFSNANVNFGLSLNVTGQQTGDSAKTASVTIPLEASRVIKISVDEKYLDSDGVFKYNGTLYPYTPVSSIVNQLSGKINATYNSGDIVESFTGVIAINDSLAPTAEILSGGYKDDDTYTRTVTVVYSADTSISTELKVNVSYKAPTSVIDYFVGNISNQTYRKEMDYSGLAVQFRYQGYPQPIQIPLSDLVDKDGTYVKTVFYEKGVKNESLDKFNKDVDKIEIIFNYNGTEIRQVYSVQDEFLRLNIDKLELAIPNLSTASAQFVKGLEKAVVFGDDVDEETIANLGVEIKVKDKDNGNYTATELAKYDTASRKITFTSGGEYSVSFSLGTADADEVRWGDNGGNSNITVSGNTVTYYFTIMPGDIDLSLEYENYAWTYGEFNLPVIYGTPRGLSQDSRFVVGKDSDKEQVDLSYKISYYPYGGGDAVEFPKNAGSYYVVVETERNDIYNSATSPLPLSGAPTITVKPKPIEIKSINKSLVYDGTEHGAKDFVVPTNFVSGITIKYTVNGIEKTETYDDSVESVLTLPTDKIMHKGTQDVTFTIINDNYVWAGQTSKDAKVTLEITARQLEISVSVDDFVYGGTKADGSPYTLTPKFTYTDKSAGTDSVTSTDKVPDNTTEALKYFFADVDKVTYTGSKEVYPADYASWNAGDYTVEITAKLKDGVHQEGDLKITLNSSEFNVSRKQIDKVELYLNGSNADGGNSNYDRNDKEFTLNNTQGYWLEQNYVLSVTVKGETADKVAINTDITQTPATQNENGKLKIKHAGEYTVTVAFASNNYEWKFAEEDKEHADLTFKYTVNAVEMGGTLNGTDGTYSWDNDKFLFDGSEHSPVLSATGLADEDGIEYETKICKEGENTEVTPNLAGKYELVITGWKVGNNAYDGTVFSVAKNYKFPEGKTEIRIGFTIESAELEKPTLTTGENENKVSVEYKGGAYYFETYIANWGSENTDNLKGKVKIKAVANDTTNNITEVTANGGMTDVCTYTVYIYPDTNYKWETSAGATAFVNAPEGIPEGTQGFTFTFEITPYTLELEWSNLDLTYDGEAQAPTVTYKSIFARDKDKVTIGVTEDSKKIDAGKNYTATAADPTGDRAFNYKLPTEITQTFSIANYTLTAPTANKTEGNFADADKTITYTFGELADLKKGWAWSGEYVTVSITGEYRDGLTEGNYVKHADTYEFDWTSNGFVAKNAGYYTVKFTINDEYTKNFCWENEDKDEKAAYTAPDIIIERQAITAPKLVQTVDGKQQSGRTLQRTGNELVPDLSWVGEKDKTLVGETTYGKFDKTNGYKTDNVSPVDTGEYYVRLNITGGNALNYVWQLNDDDSIENYSQFITQSGQTVYEYVNGEANVSVYINFAITQKILNINYTVTGYTFGDTVKTGNETTTFKNVFVLGGDDYSQLTVGSFKDVTYTQTFTFIDKENKQIGEVVINKDGAISSTSASNLLENDLPWNAGVYSVKIIIDFASDELEDREFTYTLTVDQKVITSDDVTWGGNTQVTYDGQTHTLTAELKESAIPKRADGSFEKPELIVGRLEESEDFPINASDMPYTLKVTEVEDNNYTLSGTAITEQLTISKRSIKVVINRENVQGIIYGAQVTDGTFDNCWAYPDGADDGAKFVETENYIAYELYKQSDNGLLGDKVYPVGGNAVLGAATYILVPVLTKEAELNYAAQDFENGEFTVSPREITVSKTDNEGNLKATYGEVKNINLYNADKPVYKVEWKNGTGDWLVGGDSVSDIFTLTSGATADYAAAGTYTITAASANNPNYIVEVDNDGWEFVIENADIKDVSVTGKSVEYKADEYKYLNDLLNASATFANNEAMKSTAKWYIAEKVEGETEAPESADWKEITSAGETNAFSGEYWVKVTADNHNDFVLGSSVTISITKVTLTVKLALEIFYGEASPVGFNGENTYFLGSASDLSDSRYTIEGFKGNDKISDIGATGNLSYTTNYFKGENKGEYSLDLNVEGLSSTNYNFVAAADEGGKQTSKLTVKALPVEVTFKDANISIEYWSYVGESFPYENYFNVTTDQTSTYDSSEKITIPDGLQNIIKIVSNAIIFGENGNVESTAGVDEYGVTLELLGDNYTAELPQGTIKITNAKLTAVSTVEDKSVTYNENYHNLTGTITVSGVKGEQTVNVKYGWTTDENESVDNFTELTLTGNEVNVAVPQFIDANTYYIYYVISADNHETVTITKTLTIEKGENSFTDLFNFKNKSAYDSLIAGNNPAWTYGIYEQGVHESGYNKDGDQEITSAQTKFSRNVGDAEGVKNNAIKYYLFAGEVKEVNVANLTAYTNVNKLFADWFDNGKFNAGKYTLYYVMEGNDNYDAIDKFAYFEVAQKELTIKVNDAKVTYGEEVDNSYYYLGNKDNGFDFTVEGLVNNGKGKESNTDIYVGGALPIFVSEYKKGSDVIDGGYAITLSNASGLTEGNYKVEIVNTAKLYVTPRAVTIKIEYKVSQYNYNAASNNPSPENDTGGHTLTATIGEGSFIDDGKIEDFIELATNAVDKDGTQEVGVYPIFAMFKDGVNPNNYSVSFEADDKHIFNEKTAEEAEGKYGYESNHFYAIAEEFKDTLSNVIGNIENAAGVYEITPANLKLNAAQLRNITGIDEKGIFITEARVAGTVYDGKNKIHTTEAADDSFGDLKVYARYSKEQHGTYDIEYIRDAGTYYYQFFIDNRNYIWDGSTPVGVEISPRVLNWKLSFDGVTWSENKQANYESTYEYGKEQTFSYAFENLYEVETIDTANKTITTQQTIIGGNNVTPTGKSTLYFSGFDINLNATYALSGNKLTVTATDSGHYAVTLERIESTVMKNYTFVSNESERADVTKDGKIQFTFTINPKELDVYAKDSYVQYGTTISNVGNAIATSEDLLKDKNQFRFKGFDLNEDTLEIAKQEGEDKFDISGVRYTYGGYTANSDSGNTFNIIPVIGTIKAYNYIINTPTVNCGKLEVVQREIIVGLNGYNGTPTNADKDTWDSVVYNGKARQPDLSKDNLDNIGNYLDVSLNDSNWRGDSANTGDNVFVAAAIKLWIQDGAINVGNYPMYIEQERTNTNYNVTFVNKDGEVLNGETEKEKRPVFNIRKKALTVQVVLKETDDTQFEIVYGNFDEPYYGVKYVGLVDGDKGDNAYSYKISDDLVNNSLKFTATQQGFTKEYKPWESHAGEVYTISATGIEFHNYSISWENAKMTVVSRQVTATTSDRVYTEVKNGNVINYNNGVSGIEHDARIVFVDNDIRINNPVGTYGANGEYTPNKFIDCVYNGTGFNNAAYTNSVTAPVVAGEYTVTVTFKTNGLNSEYYDFVFNESEQGKVTGDNAASGVSETQVTFRYNVDKQQRSINWNSVAAGYLNFVAGEKKHRNIENYIPEIMYVVGINNVYRTEEGNAVTDMFAPATAETLEGKQYYIDGLMQILKVNIYGIGTYTATISFNADAMHNYYWLDSSDAQYAISFSVAADSFNITSLYLSYAPQTQEVAGRWTYGEAAPEPVFGLDVANVKVVLTYRYAKLKSFKNIPQDNLVYGSMIAGITQATELDRESWQSNVPTGAGAYVMRAYYPGSGEYGEAEAYLVFEIEKAVVASPVIVSGSLSSTYTGKELSLEIEYSGLMLNIAYQGTMSSSDRGMVLHATDVKEGGYPITFTLRDEANYRWADNAQSAFVWTVNPAADNVITSFDISMLENLTYNGNGVALPYATSKYGSGDVRIEFFVDGEWTAEVIPYKAGVYKVRAVSPATANYYAGTSGAAAYGEEKQFIIKRANLTVTPSGTAVYGTPFNKDGGAGYSLEYTGFVAGRATVEGKAEYMLVNAPSKLEVNSNGYALTLKTVTETNSIDGELYEVVDGFWLENYYITVQNGVFEVSKKAVYVAVGNVSAIYGDALDLSSATLTPIGTGALVLGDKTEDLNVTVDIHEDYRLEEGVKYPVGSYMMTASYDNANYEVTFGVGIYIVRALNIRIEISTSNGVYGGAAPSATVNSIVTDSDGTNLADIEGIVVPTFNYVYYGKSNDGKWNYNEINAQTVLPTLAGSYTVKAIGSGTQNYNLVTTPAANFTIEKQTLDASAVTTRTETYTGKPITPVINPNEISDKYTVKPVQYTDVGNWTVTLVLNDFANYKWKSVDVEEREISFRIDKGDNTFVKDEKGGEVVITGWTFGQAANSPKANSQFGNVNEYIYEYSSQKDGIYTPNVPATAGTWWVRVTVPQSDNYNRATSEPVSFEIAKAEIAVPKLTVVESGDGQNTVYTGARLQSAVSGYNPAAMRIIYEGEVNSRGNEVSVYAVNAGTYKVYLALNDGNNYRWADGAQTEEGNAVLVWTIAPKKIDKPVMDGKVYMVNGQTLTFIPVGFDENTMTIEDNKTSYGGVFKVKVSLKDANNYVWSDNSVEDITFDWVVVGWDTVFIIVVSVLGVVAGIAAIAIGVQYLVHRRKKRVEAVKEAAAAAAIAESVAAVTGENPANAETENTEQTEEGKTENTEQAEESKTENTEQAEESTPETLNVEEGGKEND